MKIVGLAIVAVMLVASMLVAIFTITTTMLPVAQFTAMGNRKISTFSFPLASSYPWQSSQERQMTCWLLDTAQRKQSS
jgi:hypothetical protein